MLATRISRLIDIRLQEVKEFGHQPGTGFSLLPWVLGFADECGNFDDTVPLRLV